MGKLKLLNALAHNMGHSYLSTYHYHICGYMADWLYQIARIKSLQQIEISIAPQLIISPAEADFLALKYFIPPLIKKLEVNLQTLKISKEIVKEFCMIFTFAHERNEKIVYCDSHIIVNDGKIFTGKKIREIAYENDFDPTSITNTIISRKSNNPLTYLVGRIKNLYAKLL